MGSVYKAIQLSLERAVAVKVLAPHLAHDPEYVERFLREARAVARLNHPNVISGIDAGEANGLRYFVMEYAAGHTVKALLDRGGALDPVRVKKIALQIARALQHANEAGLVHRDVKPDNILVTKDGAAKLCDLGLAKDRPEDGGRSLGTPDYISPEQAEAITEVDIRADLYSLGATLYHMLSGRTPFTGSAKLVMAKHLTEVPTPLSEIEPGIDTELESIVVKLMQKDRDDRYQSPDDLIAALEGLGKNQAAIEVNDGPQAPRSRRRGRRRRF
jgi:serine/threonine protein kinase